MGSMELRFYLWLVAFLTQILFQACIVESKQFASPGKQVHPLQWRFFTSRTPRDWRGLWVWFYANGTIRLESLSTRKFEIPPGESKTNPQTVIQTNTYANGIWNPNNETLQKFLYKNGNPPTYAQRILSNGTLGPLFPSEPYFLKHEFIVVPRIGIGAVIQFGLEIFLLHPRDPTVRFSILPVYLNSLFAYVVLLREVDGAPVYPTKFWSNSIKARPRQELPLMTQRRFWSGSCKCIFNTFVMQSTGIFNVTNGWNLPSQPKEGMSVLELPDNLTLYYPKTIADYNRREISFMILWNIDERTAVQSVATFDRQGKFSKMCTTTFTKTK